MSKILIVDDDEDLLLTLKLLLKGKGYEVATTITCSEGLTIFYNFQPDLVILDINVGEEDGREMCRAIKSQADYQNIPVLLISGNAEALNDYVRYGANGILGKPFDSGSFLHSVNSYF